MSFDRPAHQRVYEAKLDFGPGRRATKLLVSASDHKDAWRLARHGAQSYGATVRAIRHVSTQAIFERTAAA
jgi:hypothetical protein